jgi:hypothetical protein
MRRPPRHTKHRRPFARFGRILGLLIALALLLATPASASYENVGKFGREDNAASDSEGQLANASGMAVNYTGAGGVPAGTVYAVTYNASFAAGNAHIFRYNADGEPRATWGWGVADRKEEYERCGPDGEPAYPTCPPLAPGISLREKDGGLEGEGLGQLWNPVGVAVDQATGDVYVYNFGRKEGAVQIFSAQGIPIGGFGENVQESETVGESPEKFHISQGPIGNFSNQFAVDDVGDVYISDYSGQIGNESIRVMVFKPQSPGDYEHYVYAGRTDDIAVSTSVFGQIRSVALDQAGNLYTASAEFILEYSLAEPGAPICQFKVPGGQLRAMTVNPKRGEVFYLKVGLHQLGRCDMGTGNFVEKASIKEGDVGVLAFNPALSFGESRPAGILYYANGGTATIFAPAEVAPPAVESETVSSVGTSSAVLHAQINPEGSQTSYAFQYLTQGAYEANDPDEIQSLAVGATSGVFGLGFEGHRYGGEGSATLNSGSATATALKTATGTATLKGASGTATLKAARGSGTVISGSTAVTALATSEGSFEVGQQVSGTGIPPKTTIAAVTAGELTLSEAAQASAANTPLSAGSTALGSLTAGEGTFEVGEGISGEGIPNETTIVAVKAGQLTISKPPIKPGSGISIKAGSNVLTSVTTSSGHFEAGQPVEGAGIPSSTKIVAVEGAKLTLSRPIAPRVWGGAIGSAGPAPLAVGQRIEGPGIPADTTIVAAKEGQLTLSNPATSSGPVTFHAGLAFDASAGEVRHALESLPAIGADNVAASGGPGDETGSNPYRIHFSGDLSNVDLPLVEADSSGLSGGPASATVQGENDGGNGFAEGSSESPVGGAVLGNGQEALGAGTNLTGLDPDTAYRYRVIATSKCNPEEEEELCEDTGPTQAFHTFPAEAPKLPDHRAYELVSPPRKAGGEVFPLEPFRGSCRACKPNETTAFPRQSSPDGEAVVYEGSPFSNTGGARKENEYLSKRTPSGWQTTNLSPELIQSFKGGKSGFKAFNAELTKDLIYQVSPSLTPDAPSEFSNLYTQDTANPTALTPLLGAAPPNRFPGNGEDFKLRYAGASADFSHLLFEANDALTAETPFAPEAVDNGSNKSNLYESIDGATRLVNVLPGNTTTTPGVFGAGRVSFEGFNFNHVISTDGSRAFWSDESGQVYVRENGEATREIPDHAGKFLTASANGSKVLLSDGQLYDLNAEELTDLTEGKGGFQGIAGQSEGLSSIYFVDTAVLTGEENERGEAARPGRDNLYLHRGTTTKFITTLLPEDDNFIVFVPEAGDWHSSAAFRTAEASPDGRYLAFLSRAPLTGSDNTTAGGEAVTGIFLFDSATGKLSCPSCNPTGELSLGDSRLPLNNPSSTDYQLQSRYLTNEGRLYFDTQESLVPFDTNEGVEDVYEYEHQGVGSCEREGGCVSLVSAGHEAVDSNFFAIGESGKDVFFTTRDQLTLKDKDDLIDLYDAREDGGIPSETEAARSECQGEACQVPVSAPNDPTPGSSTFEGAGNVNEPKAAKKHAKKHKKKRHTKKHAHKRAANHNRGGAK